MSAPLTSKYALKMKNASTRLEDILVSVKKAIGEITGDSAQVHYKTVLHFGDYFFSNRYQ